MRKMQGKKTLEELIAKRESQITGESEETILKRMKK